MSHDVLAALRRRLVTQRRTARPDRPSNETAGTASHHDTTLLADGGEDARTARRNDDTDGGGVGGDDDLAVDDPEGDDAHLRDLPDGAGCTEIWEHLSERQAEEREPRAGERGRTDGQAVECRADD